MNPQMPTGRIAGACFVIVLIAALFTLNVAGYDPNPQGFEGELQRLGGISAWQVSLYAAI